MAHAILRLDNVQATQDNSLMRSGLFYTTVDSTDTLTDIDNGLPVEVGALITGERELRKLTTATASPTVLGITSTPEVNSLGNDADTDGTNLGGFYNKAGDPVRVHLLQAGDIFSVSAEAIGTTPTVGQGIAISNGKWSGASSSTIATCIAIDVVNGVTLYVIEMGTDKVNQ